MKSWFVTSSKDATTLELRDLPVPEPKAGEILAKVHAAGLNRKRSELEPAICSEIDQRRNIDGGGDGKQKQEEVGRLLEAAQRQLVDGIDEVGRDSIQQACR